MPTDRDLPIATVVGMLVVTSTYLLMNIAYFTVLTPIEFVQSDAVAQVSFALFPILRILQTIVSTKEKI